MEYAGLCAAACDLTCLRDFSHVVAAPGPQSFCIMGLLSYLLASVGYA